MMSNDYGVMTRKKMADRVHHVEAVSMRRRGSAGDVPVVHCDTALITTSTIKKMHTSLC
jgi:hypothetical protein